MHRWNYQPNSCQITLKDSKDNEHEFSFEPSDEAFEGVKQVLATAINEAMSRFFESLTGETETHLATIEKGDGDFVPESVRITEDMLPDEDKS
jgi:hypothetical protein